VKLRRRGPFDELVERQLSLFAEDDAELLQEEWHLPLRADALADFARAFPSLRYEVRAPTLDDLFLKLALV